MQCFLTGASGFIGANLARQLAARGHSLKALARPGSDWRGMAGVECERVEGDLSQRAPLEKAMRGCDWCFHVAASYHLWLRDYRPMYAANVEGTRHVLEAAAGAGCRRIVYTSTVGCIGLPSQGRGDVVPGDETTPVSEAQMRNHYKRSKWRAEVLARELAARGCPVVIVNPSAPIGPFDLKPTPTGKVVLDFLQGKLPAYLDTGLNWVHVRDVAAGEILAAEKGRIGERYILGNAEGNWTMKHTLEVLAGIDRAAGAQVSRPLRAGLGRGLWRRGAGGLDGPSAQKRRWPECGWPNIKCSSARPRRSANWACRKRPHARPSRTRLSGFDKT